MVVLGVVAMAVMHYGLRRIYWTLLAATAVVIVLFYVMRLPYFGEIGERVTNLLSGEQDASDIERQQMIDLGIRLFKDKPIFGYGLDNYAALCFRETYSHHNYIELLVSGGVIALIMYYLIFLVPALGLLQARKKGQKMEPLHMILLVWLAVELLFGVAMVQLYNKNSWLLMGVLLSEAIHATYRKNTLQERRYEANS